MQAREDREELTQRRSSPENLSLLRNDELERQMAGCCFAACQAPVQAFLRPAMWVPGIKRLHLFEQEWKIDASPDQCLDAFQAAAESLSEAEHLHIHKIDKQTHFIRIFAFTTNCNWLDVVEVRFNPDSDSSTSTASVRSFSTGFLPACIPLAFLWNVLLFWVPFSGNGANTHRINMLRDAMQLSVNVTSEKTCSCAAP